MHKVIFACIHNAGGSQMAAAFFNQLAHTTKAEAVSAGTDPGVRVHPEVLTIMQEVGIDLSHAKPQKLTQELADDASLLASTDCVARIVIDNWVDCVRRTRNLWLNMASS